ncbi:MAG: hypothetical protein ACTSV2_13065 [Candidatus Thorarchaeota archaeon]
MEKSKCYVIIIILGILVSMAILFLLYFTFVVPFIIEYPTEYPMTRSIILFLIGFGALFTPLLLALIISNVPIGKPRINMKSIRMDIFNKVNRAELEILDQSFEFIILSMGLTFTILSVLLSEVFHLALFAEEIVIASLFYLGYKIGKLRLAIDLRIWIIDMGIRVVCYLVGIITLVLLSLPIAYLVFYQYRDPVILAFGAVGYLIGMQLDVKYASSYINGRVELLFSNLSGKEQQECIEKVMYLGTDSSIVTIFPLYVILIGVSPIISLDVFYAIVVMFFVFAVIPTIRRIGRKQRETFTPVKKTKVSIVTDESQ